MTGASDPRGEDGQERRGYVKGQRRMLHLRFFGSPDVGRLTHRQRLLFVGLIALADDDGRGRADPYYLKGQLFPYDQRPSAAEIKNDLSVIAAHTKTVVWMHGDGNLYYALLSWRRFQSISRNVYKPSAFPAPPPDGCFPDSESFLKPFGNDSEHILSKGRVGKGRAGEIREEKMQEEKPASSIPLKFSTTDREKKTAGRVGGLAKALADATADAKQPLDSTLDSPEDSIETPTVPVPVLDPEKQGLPSVPSQSAGCPLTGDSAALLRDWARKLGAEPTDQVCVALAEGLAGLCRIMQGQGSCARDGAEPACREALEAEVARVAALAGFGVADRVELLASALPLLARKLKAART